MLEAAQNLIDDYEIIFKENPLGSGFRYRYIKTEKVNYREFIQPAFEMRREDVRFDKVVCSASEVREFAKGTLEALGFEYLRVEEQLHDIAYIFMERFNINCLNCRMELIYSDKCKRFHVDNVFLRMITTLLGPGTELQLSDELQTVLQVKTGDTVLVKGKQFPGEPTKVLHRSPKISHLGTPRLIFVMDY